MAIVTRTTAKSYFKTGDKPTQSQFGDFIDSSLFYEDTSDFGRQLVSASSATSARSLLGAGTVGNNLFIATTTASGQNQLGGGTVGKALFEANTTASAQQNIGGGTVGRQIFEAITTASATNIVLQQATSSVIGVSYLSSPITIANNSTTPNTDIDFSAGNFIFSDKTGQAIATAMTKKLQSSGSWSAGTNGNMLLSGAKEADSTYHLFAIYNPTTNTSDFAAIKGVANTDPNPTAFLPSGYTKWKRVGSIITNASGNIIFFIQDQNKFILPLKKDVDSIGTTSASLFTLTAPLGISTEAIIDYYIFSSVPIHYGLITSPYQLDQAPTSDLFNIYVHGSLNITSEKRTYIKTDKSSRIRTRFTGSTDISQRIFTSGWIDNLI